MATQKRSTSATKTKVRDQFFETELAGETAPSLATMRTLYERSISYFGREPWTRVSDSQLVLFKDPESGELCFCCVMGALKEVFSLHVFIGSEGYRAYQAIMSGDTATIDSIYALSRSVFVEFASRGELAAPDKTVLQAFGHPTKPGTLGPLYRSMRPGYHPWYVTEEEARLLTRCLDSVMLVLDAMEANPGIDYWLDEDTFPLVARNGEISTIRTPDPSNPVLEMPGLDDERVAAIKKAGFPTKGVLELDHFFSPASVGKKHERKACVGLAMAIDAKTAFAYPPQLSSPGDRIGDVLSDVLLTAVETSHIVPLEVHVRGRDRKHLLDRLARELGFRVRATESLPAFDFAKEQLEEMILGG